MEHSIVYLGYFTRAFGNQQVGVFQFVDKDGNVRAVNEPTKIGGVVFGCMEDKDPLRGGKRFFAVRACYDDLDVILERPVLFKRKYHTDGKWFGPNPPTFGDASAENLLSDMVIMNSQLAQQLRQIATRAGLTLSV